MAPIDKIIVLETKKIKVDLRPPEQQLTEQMTLEERQNIIRFGTKVAKGEPAEKEVQVEVNLLEKYVPLINIKEIKYIANDLVLDFKEAEKEIVERKK